MIKFLKFGGGREEAGPTLGKGFVPVNRVKELSGKGFSEPEMIDVLRREGFSAEEIDRALTQALRLGVTGEPEQTSTLPTMESMQMQQQTPSNQIPQIPERSLQYPEGYSTQQPQYPAQQEGYGTEELIESIVQERMNEVDQRFHELSTKQSDLERGLSSLHHQLSIMSKGRTQTEEMMISKIDSFKDALLEISARMSGLEKAFKDALPALIESVRALTDLVQRLKRESQ
jgi:DNA-binding transcriptional MerR regulator